MLTAGHERRHAPGSEPDWRESWHVDWWSRGGELGGYVHLELIPNEALAWYWASVVGEGRDLVMVIDNEVPAPKSPSLELRTEGLWADLTVEVPFDHLTLGCEAFGLRLDDPAEVFGRMLGERVPFGLDLDVDTDGTVSGWGLAGKPVAPSSVPSADGGYEIPCRVHGDVLVGAERIDLDGIGHRRHSWGPAVGGIGPPTMRVTGALMDGTRLAGTDLSSRPVGSGSLTDGTRLAGRVGATVTVTLAERMLEVATLALAPVPVPGRDGTVGRLMRALCRLRDPATGATGAGWIDWVEPAS